MQNHPIVSQEALEIGHIVICLIGEDLNHIAGDRNVAMKASVGPVKEPRKPVILSIAQTLHQKMPYIWRFLKPHTRRHMIELAKKPVKEINIPGHVFPDSPNKFQTKKLSQRYKHLRKTYRKI